jgi:hypothetical protein
LRRRALQNRAFPADLTASRAHLPDARREEGPDRKDAARTLLGWAGRVGYRRV